MVTKFTGSTYIPEEQIKKKKKKTGKQNMDEHIFLSNLNLMKHSPFFSFSPSSSFPKFDRTQIKTMIRNEL